MEIIRSIFAGFAFVFSLVSIALVLAWINCPKDSLDSEIERANLQIEPVTVGRKKPSFEYWLNFGYLKIVRNFRMLLAMSVGVMIASLFMFNILSGG